MSTLQDIKKELGKLVLFEPFFATLALGLDIEVSIDPNCTAGINSKKMVFGESFWAKLNPVQKRTLICHECLHLANLHDLRKPAIIGNDPELFKLWNQACDWAINQHLRGERFQFPPDGLTNPAKFAEYNGMSAEEIFKKLYDERQQDDEQDDEQDEQDDQDDQDDDQDDQGGQGDQDDQQDSQDSQDGQDDKYLLKMGFSLNQASPFGQGDQDDGQDGQGWGQILPSDEEPSPEAQAERKQLVQQAISAGERAGSDVSCIKRDFEELLKPELDWRDLLARWVEGRAQSDWSYQRPKQSGSLLLPRLDSPAIGKIACIIDTSGSMNPTRLSKCVAELLSCMEVFETDGIDQSITTILSDTAVQDCFELDDATSLPKLTGGGGTDFKNAFEKIKGLDDIPLGVVVLTDGYVEVPANQEPDCETLWICINGSKFFEPAFGEVITIK